MSTLHFQGIRDFHTIDTTLNFTFSHLTILSKLSNNASVKYLTSNKLDSQNAAPEEPDKLYGGVDSKLCISMLDTADRLDRAMTRLRRMDLNRRFLALLWTPLHWGT